MCVYRTGPVARTLADMGQLVGRSAEVTTLRRLLAEAAEGRPCALVVHGEAGVGKTRLVREVLADAGATVLWGTCVRFGASTLPFAPLVVALRPWLTDADGGLESSRLIPVVGAALDRLSADELTVLVVDDLQWADVSSLDALAYVVAGFREQRLAVVATCRDEHRPEGHPLHAWFADLRRMAGFEELHLDRFDLAGTELLVAQTVGRPLDLELVTEVHERSGGNPYLADLLVRDLPVNARHLPVNAPDRLTEALRARWHTLSAPARLAVQILAVGGRPQPRSLFTQVAGAHGLSTGEIESAVVEATVQGVLAAPSNDELWFRHPLLAEVLYGDVLPDVAAGVHATYADLLGRMDDVAERRRADDLAVHHLQAGHLDEAFTWSMVAADAAAESAASASEWAHLERACGLWQAARVGKRASTRDHVDLLLRTARVGRLVGRNDSAVRLLEQARALVSIDTDRELACTLLATWCDLVWERDAPVQAVRPELFEALGLVEDLPDSPARVSALVALAGACAWDGRAREAGTYADEALAIARRSGSDAALVGALVCRAQVRTPDINSRMDHVVEGHDLARRIGDAELMSEAAILRVNLLELVGRTREAAHLAREASAEGLAGGSLAWSYFLAVQAASLLLDLGDWDEAERLTRMALAARQPGIPGAFARLVAADRALLVGDLATARAHLDRALELVPQNFAGLHFHVTKVQVHLLVAERDLEGAVAWMLARLEHPTVQDNGDHLVHRAWTAMAMAELAESARDRGDRGAVAHLCAQLDAVAADLEVQRAARDSVWDRTPDGRRTARFAEAEEARCRRDADEERRWEVAAAAASEAGTPWYEAYALWRQVQAAGRTHAARARLAEPLRRAHRIAVDLGARPLVERVEFLATSARIPLAEAKVPEQRNEPDRGLLAGLTPREHEVMAHLSVGRSNTEIAESLTISEKTVSVHVSNILRKTGTSSRVEAAALAHRE